VSTVRTLENRLDAWTTDQLFAEVLKRCAGDAPAVRLAQARTEIEGTPFAVVDEHLPQLHRALAALTADSENRPEATDAAPAVELDEDEEVWQGFFL